MTPVRRSQFDPNAIAMMALPSPPARSRFGVALLNARDSLMIIGYVLALRVLILARRWNY